MGKIMIVEDETLTFLDLKIRLEQAGHTVIEQVMSLDEAVSCSIHEDPDIVLMDITIQGQDDGIMVADIISEDLQKPVVFLTGHFDQATRQRARAIANSVYLTKPYSESLLLGSVEYMIAQTTYDTAAALPYADSPCLSSADKFIRYLFINTHETAIHSYRMKVWSLRLAEMLRLNERQRELIGNVAILHDVGKILIDNNILEKPGSLTHSEYAEMQRHAAYAELLLHDISECQDFLPIIRHHHERWDGTGYPDRLYGHEIPLAARIISLADSFDVMTHERSYKKAMSYADALREIEQCAGTQFDPELAAQFVKCVSEHMTLNSPL